MMKLTKMRKLIKKIGLTLFFVTTAVIIYGVTFSELAGIELPGWMIAVGEMIGILILISGLVLLAVIIVTAIVGIWRGEL